ncbi:YbhB/YbcL family Raf kinase inhibitor-like protein [Chlorobaculum thiosulfatiphilum]|uniref:YbhB/YbcL family Raf kinase inhibitor-like protein n=2 Tax=Chlorobaculum thiosulfatiphilum TaxID=115852 RepID=A0A5C4S6U0_CHLTI|nr:YbhB/YbcL family Raf kinase inhibitor-like protein [Chlorobaculum thiosulfatiphilum]TNJ39224.1 YbhB/YbcL family Raf kinase inhibitor-like protein [Chlorobaculum thiosulfatiphilum]
MKLSRSIRNTLALLFTTALLMPATLGAAEKGEAMTFALASPAFRHMGAIPALYTCEGKNISPPLAWKNLPKGTKSLVLIVDDPDAPDPAAPKFTWIHWVLCNIPPETTGLAEEAGNRPAEAGMLEGLSSWNRGGYGGPCPPIGTHRYFFKLYALDTVLDDLLSPLKAEVEAAMQAHILGQAVLIGTYKKRGK